MRMVNIMRPNKGWVKYFDVGKNAEIFIAI